MRPVKILRVLPNPWLHIHVYDDGTARPVCAVHVDMDEHVPQANRYVGARIDHAVETVPKQERRVGSKTVVVQRARHEVYWKFATTPEEIPNTGYYRDQIHSGALFAADLATASAAGVEFTAPAMLLAKAREDAIRAFDAANGDGSWADQGEELPTPTKPAEPKNKDSK